MPLPDISFWCRINFNEVIFLKKARRVLVFAALLTAFLFLILDTECALTGMSQGIQLCLSTVIPSVFPFLFLGPMLASMIPPLPVLRPLGKVLKIPPGSENLLLTSFLCGYPAGAKSVYAAWERGQLSGSDARRMLAFCNNAGPAFIFGVGGALFQHRHRAFR